MKRNERASFLNAIFIMLVAIPTLAAAQVSVQPAAASVYAMSSGRLAASVAAVLGLIGVIIGGLALARPAGRFGTASGRLGNHKFQANESPQPPRK